MESLERSLNNVSIDDAPWRPHEQQPLWSNNGIQQQQQPRAWAPPVQPQFANRSPWQQDSNEIEQNVNEALGLSGMAANPPQWGGMPNSEYDKQIWADPTSDVQYPPPPPHAPFGALNGLGGPSADWSMGSQPHNPVWSNGGMGKESDEFWKQQQPQQQQHYPMPLLQGAWNPRGMNHGPPGQGPRGGPMMQQQDYQWGGPNNMGGNKQMNRPWGQDNNRGMSGMPPRNGRPNHNQGRYSGNMQGGVDVSVPPPMDMHMGGGMGGMRNMGAPNGGHGSWKNNNSGGGNGGHGGQRNYNNRGGMGHNGGGNQGGNNMWNNAGGNGGGNGGNMQQYMGDQSYNNASSFPIGGASDDLTLSVWHDPNGELKKWQRDTGVSYWGDPEKQTERTINLWIVAEGADEDLESALNRCPVPQKKGEDNQRFPFPVPAKRPIVVTGWGELPENDPNNPTKSESTIFDENNRWNDVPTEQNPWYLPNHNATTFSSDNTTGSWVQGGTIPLNEPGSNQVAVAEMLKNAVDKGYLDQSVPMLANLPPTVLQYVNMLLVKIPALESVDNELKQIVDASKPDDTTEIDPQNPSKYMNDSQKLEYNRLIIEVTTAKIEVQDYSKKVNRALVEAGIVQPQEQRAPAAVPTSEEYHYSFLE
ncbi:CRE-AIN-1 protein [Caenorhabditis remanei]|uniref:CRE-AIN-1 protein n=2 Tax=Caenorhabditis remanei TaxID=31234 RepID=E3MKQ5_CAERE|nr:CRE-AIN-1 protein [Caenorhabditis remanei]